MSSGLSMQIGLAKETTYGTRAVPTKFYEVRSEALAFERTWLVSQQLGGGSLFPRGSRRVENTRGGSGPLTMEVPNQGFGSIVDLMHPNTVTPVQQAATTAYLQTHNIGLASASKSATIQVGRPSTDGTVRPFDYYGCMLLELGLAWDLNDFLMATPTFDIQEEKTDQTLATRSLPSGLGSFSYKGGSILFDGVAGADIGAGSLTIGQPMQTDWYPLGNAGLKSKPIQNERPAATGQASARFADLTYHALSTAGTQKAIVLLFEGDTIASTYKYTVRVTMSDCRLTVPSPNVDGPGVLTQTINWGAYFDGTNAPVKIEITDVVSSAL